MTGRGWESDLGAEESDGGWGAELGGRPGHANGRSTQGTPHQDGVLSPLWFPPGLTKWGQENLQCKPRTVTNPQGWGGTGG